MAAPVLPVTLILGGAYLSWFGVHYWRTDVAWPSAPIKAVLTGQPVPVGQKTNTAQLTTSVAGPGMQIFNDVTSSGAELGSGFGDQIARTALRYQGAGYVWGGDASVPGKWDCSSFVS